MNKYPDIDVAAERIGAFRQFATAIRRESLTMVKQGGAGHPGGDLSSADILTVLYNGILRVDPANPGAPGRDRFVMSKGHCSAGIYATLALAGFFPKEELATFMKPNSRLSGHPHLENLPGIEASTGPLGHGLPVAVGLALASRLTGAGWRSFVLTGDGEMQEGSNWEAMMAAAHYELDNLTLIIDRNHIQQGDRTERIMRLEPLADRVRAFGFAVREVDGHAFEQLIDALGSLPFEPGAPNCVIAHTVKGKGVSFIEDRPEWHHHVPTSAELEAALRELGGGAQ